MQEGQHISIRNKPVTTQRYDVRLKESDHWGVFFWDSEERLIVHSAWGTWGHRWDGQGKQWNAEFLERLNHDYLAEKFRPGPPQFYAHETQDKLREVAAGLDLVGPDWADAYDQIDEVATEEDARCWLRTWKGEVPDGCVVRGRDRAVLAMLEALWPTFVRMVRERVFTCLDGEFVRPPEPVLTAVQMGYYEDD